MSQNRLFSCRRASVLNNLNRTGWGTNLEVILDELGGGGGGCDGMNHDHDTRGHSTRLAPIANVFGRSALSELITSCRTSNYQMVPGLDIKHFINSCLPIISTIRWLV